MMRAPVTACAFPGISSSANMRNGIKELLQNWISPFSESVSDLLGTDICKYIGGEKYLGIQDIRAQVVSYAVSCAVFDEIQKSCRKPSYLCGYSVGVFSALYAARSISFTSGVASLIRLNNLVQEVYDERSPRFMGVVIGLNEGEATSVCSDLEIINQNSETSLVITGKAADAKGIESSLLSSGALYFRLLPSQYPYHSSELVECKDEWVEKIRQEKIVDPLIPIVSSTNGRVLRNSNDCFEELKNNYCSPFSWLHLLNMIWEMGVHDIYECGVGRELARIGKYSGVAHRYHHYV